MMGILLDLVYLVGLVATSPVWVHRMIRHGRYRGGWSQRLGGIPVRYGLQPIIWIHGVSLGEINAARTLVREIHSQLPDFRVVVSSTTDTGMSAARRLFAPDHVVFHWPLDFSLTVGRALNRMRPDLVVLMEGEFWPNFLAACNRRGIPVVAVNARLAAGKGYPRYRMLGPIARKLMFARVTAVGVQDEIYAERFASLGVARERIHVTGMMKFDTAEIAQRIDGADELAAAVGLGSDEQLVVAGGTGPGEEEIILDFWGDLSERHPKARLAIVPRKPERFDAVGRAITERGFSIVRRSERPDGCAARSESGPRTVVLGDTMGELRKFYSLAACVFVGRSLVPMGGSDMIEAAALGKPTAFGPHTFNFPQADALAANGTKRVSSGDELMQWIAQCLSDPAAAARAGQTAQDYVRSQQGATGRNVEMICSVLHRVPPVTEGTIATEILEQ